MIFPGLYSLAGSKGAKVAEVRETSGVFGTWNPRFSRPFNDWGMELGQLFISLTASKTIIPLKRDKPFWKGDQNDNLLLKSYFKSLEGGLSRQAPVKVLWNPYIPTKAGFFEWEAWWVKVLTMEQLKKRGFHLASKFPFSGKDGESLEQILIHCPLIWELYAAMFSTFGAIGAQPFLVHDFLCC